MPRRQPRHLLAAAVVALAPVQVLAAAHADPPETANEATEGHHDLEGPVEVARPGGAVVATAADEPHLVTEPGTASAPASADGQQAAGAGGSDPFAARYPSQMAATQIEGEPSGTRWALLIGINEQLGRVSDNYGARQDVMDLRAHLLSLGWRDDHILVIADRDATRTNIVRGIQWLADRTDAASTAVFHYSGHSKKWYGQDHDGDGEVTDEGLWPTDDRFIPDSELVAHLDGVHAGELWLNFATCNSAGFNDPGLERPGRLLTFSSGELQKSYEWPAKDNSVWGYYLIDQALNAGLGDLDGDGIVTVEEAVHWAAPPSHELTRTQSHGPQDAVMIDHQDGAFRLDLPPPPAPSSGGGPDDGAGGCLLGLCERD